MKKSHTKLINKIPSEIEDSKEDEIKYQILDEDTVEMINKVFYC